MLICKRAEGGTRGVRRSKVDFYGAAEATVHEIDDLLTGSPGQALGQRPLQQIRRTVSRVYLARRIGHHLGALGWFLEGTRDRIERLLGGADLPPEAQEAVAPDVSSLHMHPERPERPKIRSLLEKPHVPDDVQRHEGVLAGSVRRNGRPDRIQNQLCMCNLGKACAFCISPCTRQKGRAAHLS